MTERKCAHVARRRCADEVRATYCTSVREMFPTRHLFGSSTAIEEMLREIIVSRAVITLASDWIEMTLVEPIPSSPICFEIMALQGGYLF
jgi:hypothetical protein